LSLNIFGMLSSMRHPSLELSTAGETLDRLDNLSVNSRKDYIESINQIVHEGTVNLWRYALPGYTEPYLQPGYGDGVPGVPNGIAVFPVEENYVLYLLGYIYPEYRRYESGDYRKAIERGVAVCSQQSLIVMAILKEKGIETKMLALSWHRVATVLADPATDEWWILDPDLGVVIKCGVPEVDNRPTLVHEAYVNTDLNADELSAMELRYTDTWDNPQITAQQYMGRVYYYEIIAGYAIWAIPAMLLLFAVWLWHKTRRTKEIN